MICRTGRDVECSEKWRSSIVDPRGAHDRAQAETPTLPQAGAAKPSSRSRFRTWWGLPTKLATQTLHNGLTSMEDTGTAP